MHAEGARFTSYIDRRRDVLITFGDPRPLHVDLELHLLSIGVVQDAFTRSLLKDGLSALALWQVSRPRFETHGWTFGIAEPRMNLFFSGSAPDGTVVGRAFHEHLAAATGNIFYAQTSRPSSGLQTSCAEVEGNDIFAMVEQYAHRSDQVPVRLFRNGDRVAYAALLPVGDRDWLQKVETSELFALEKEAGEGVKLIAESRVTFRCGCDGARIVKVLREIYREADELFQGDPAIEAECPRCGTKHAVTRESFERQDAA